MVDLRTQMKFLDFYKTKDEMVEPTCEKIHKWKENGYNVTTIRCDNAGENVKLQK